MICANETRRGWRRQKILPLDGGNLLPRLTGGPEGSWKQRGTVFWAMNVLGLQRRGPRPPNANAVARKGEWKLMMLDRKPVALFNVVKDPDEKVNVLGNPAIATVLERELNAWLKENPGQPRRERKGKKKPAD